jgi:DNA-binding MarR family transcriptional regulator
VNVAGPIWLDDQEQQAWLSVQAMTKLLDAALDRQLQRDSGLSHMNYIIMSVLSSRADRTMSMTRLANLTNSSQSRMSHAVARLEDRGWVTRARSEDRRRLVLATLTPAGFDVVVAAAPGHAAAVRQLVFDRLSPEQVHQLYAINSVILEALAERGFPHVPATAPSSDDG